MASDRDVYFLSDRLVAEPLINRWTAWWLTVAPAPASLHLANSQLRALRSYLQDPALHHSMASRAEVAGTTFVALDPKYAPRIAELVSFSERELEQNLRFASAFAELQSVVHQEAKGQAMLPFYGRIPDAARGLVELVYDFHNRPTVKLIEGLTYASRLYRPDLQSFALSAPSGQAARPPFFSTPRVGDELFDWKVRFDSPQVDRFFGADLAPLPLAELAELVGLSPDDARLSSWVTREAPVPPPRFEGPGVRLRSIGHACVLLETRGTTIALDPFVPSRPDGSSDDRLSWHALPAKIDYALITHAHSDHFMLETLLRLRGRIGTLVVPRSSGALLGDVSLKKLCEQIGFRKVVELDALDRIPFEGGEIVGVPFLGEHGDLAQSKVAYYVRSGKETFLFSADASLMDERTVERTREALGPVETLFMNTEIDGSPPSFTMEALFPKSRDRKVERDRKCRGSTAAEGLRTVEILGVKRVFNYAMGLEPWFGFMLGPAPLADSPRMRESAALLEQCRARGVEARLLRWNTELLLGA